MSEDDKAEIQRLRAENESLKNKKTTEGTLSMKVSEKVIDIWNGSLPSDPL
jgi:hypothetical protein